MAGKKVMVNIRTKFISPRRGRPLCGMEIEMEDSLLLPGMRGRFTIFEPLIAGRSLKRTRIVMSRKERIKNNKIFG